MVETLLGKKNNNNNNNGFANMFIGLIIYILDPGLKMDLTNQIILQKKT